MINKLEPIKDKWNPLEQKFLKVLFLPLWLAMCCLGMYKKPNVSSNQKQ